MSCVHPALGRELLRADGFVYKVLDASQRDAAGAVLARAFCTEPVCAAVSDLHPEMKTHYHDWMEFVDYWMDHCCDNGLSVYVLDEINHRVAGVFVVRDLFYFPEGFEEAYPRASIKPISPADKTLRPWMNFLWDLDAMAGKEFPPLASPALGEAVDLWLLGVHPDYRGNKIANHLIRACLPLLKTAGYKYATIEATSTFTSSAAKFNNFTAVVSTEARDWLWDGKPLYTNPPAPHGTWTFWVKDLTK